LTIRNAINNRSFIDTRGQEATAFVEYAPFQKIPRHKGKAKVDARQGTIDDDPEFLAFVENLTHTGTHGKATTSTVVTDGERTDANNGQIDAPAQKVYQDPLAIPTNAYDAPIHDGKVTTTPLVEYIRQQKTAPKVKDKGKSKEDDDSKGSLSGSTRRRDRDRRRRSEKDKDRDSKTSSSVPEKILLDPKLKDKSKGNVKASVTETSSNSPRPVGKILTPTAPVANETNPRPQRKERGNASSAAAILQRDLGVNGGRRDRRGRGGDSATTASSSAKDPNSGGLSPTEPKSSEGAAANAVKSPSRPRDRRSSNDAKTPKNLTSPSQASVPSTSPDSRRTHNRQRGDRGPNRRDEPSSNAHVTPVAILKPERRPENNAGTSRVDAKEPSTAPTQVDPPAQVPSIPTGPAAGVGRNRGGGGRGRNRGPPPPSQQQQTSVAPNSNTTSGNANTNNIPTGPKAMTNPPQGPRGTGNTTPTQLPNGSSGGTNNNNGNTRRPPRNRRGPRTGSSKADGDNEANVTSSQSLKEKGPD